MTLAEVRLWGRRIAAVQWLKDQGCATFQYDPDFARSGIEVSPIEMPLNTKTVYAFRRLPFNTFRGLPGLLADSLPDKFGNALINAWLARQGRRPETFNPVERLCYTGNRGMGALEYRPAVLEPSSEAEKLNVAALVKLAGQVLSKRDQMETNLDADSELALRQIIHVGTSAGGARAKAVVSYNESTGEVRSGETHLAPGFSHWLLKFDGVSGNKDKELEDPLGYCKIEYAYHLMAQAAGIHMMECRLLKENGRAHFMTRRFDRTGDSGKLHMQSFGGLAHYDFNSAGTYAYEQAFMVFKQLNLSVAAREEQFRRTIFNILARNQDDHVKNIAFLMNRAGEWSLSPAYDVTYAYNPTGDWTSQHQMSVNGKRDDFKWSDVKHLANVATIKSTRVKAIFEEVNIALGKWDRYAETAGVDEETAREIGRHHRHIIPT